ncbi:MAG: extracellular solute-binding protein [Firmicutes bacterium]|nr:extracellular solute-binding protein [Bacillota bacterium]
MKKFFRITGVVVAIAMIAGVLYGCGAKGPAATQPPATQAPATEAPATEAPKTEAPVQTETPTEAPTEAPAPAAPIVISFFNVGGVIDGFDQSDPVWTNNPVAQKILADTNIQVKWDFPTGDGNDKLSLLLASGDYPEVVLGPNDVNLNTMISEGIAIPLDDLINQYGADYLKSMGSILDMTRSSDGHIYSLARGYGDIPAGSTPPGFGSGFIVREDAYEGIGSPPIKTLDDIYNILVQFSQKYPTNYKGDSVWPLGGYVQTWQNGIQTLLEAAGMENDIWYVNNGQIQYWVRSPQALDVIKFYNKCYREGLLDPEAFTSDRATWTTNKVATARTLSYFGGWWMTWTTQNDYVAAGIPDGDKMTFVPYAFAATASQQQKPKLVPINRRGNASVVVTTACKNPEAVMQLCNYLATPEGNFMVQNGVEGIMWDMVNNKPVMKQAFIDRWLAGESDEKFAAETGLRMYNYIVSTDIGRSPWGTYWILKDDPVVMGDAKAAIRDANLGPYWYDAYPTGGLFAGAPEDIGMLVTKMDEMFNNQLYVSVMADSEAACEADFQQYVSDLETAGLAAYENYANTVYQSRIK